MTFIPLPNLFTKEEVIIGDFPFERIGRDTKESISIIEIVMISRVFMLLCPPTTMIKIREHWMIHILISFIKTFYLGIVLF